MNYIELHLTITPDTEENRDIFVAQLGDLDYESFIDAEDGTLAYKKNGTNSSVQNDVDQLFIPDGVSIKFTSKIIEDQNWNALWESNFSPIVVDNRCMIRASFHNSIPNVEYDIVIDPKMSFGTGHHQTTHLMVEQVLQAEIFGKTILDMGCGTGVLAILAEMRGAKKIVAIDNDEWAFNNTLENIKKNGCCEIIAKLGDASLLVNLHFDVILANINLNILLADMQKYIKCLNDNGTLFCSGILTSNIDTLTAHAKTLNLEQVSTQTKDNWAMVAFKRKQN